MRAVGGPQVNFAHESQMDQLAHKLNMNPLTFRCLNYLQPGQALPNGQVLHDAIQLNEATERVWQALEEIPVIAEVGTRKIGRGISANFGGYGVPGNAASCAIEMQQDGHIVVSIGVCDIGGGQSSSVAQIAADVLGMTLDSVTLRLADTMTTPLVGATAGSKTLYYCSHATFMAAQALRKRVLEIAADMFEAQREDLQLQDGEITVRDQTRKKVTLLQVIEEARMRDIPLTEHATFYTPKEKKFDSKSGTGIDWPGFTFGVHAAEVAVDEDTGEVSILRYACCHDVGRALHPQSVVGQMHGGVAQGIGFTLMEQVAIKNGIIQTPSLLEYLIPTSLDIPEITTILLESGEGLGAYANRGIGEPPAAASAGAIANAIYDAVRVRITTLPITSERVFTALQNNADKF
jgi:CO/xanthine dehydrogenase Mo-binding subunit